MNITIRNESKKSIPKSHYKSLLKLRYKVFKKRLNWEIETDFGLESDDYDTEDAKYLYASYDNISVCGCWRILPTTGRYMLKDTFPVLLGKAKAPESKTVYELSRFAVDKDASTRSHEKSKITMEMFRAIYLHAIENGIEEYVTVTSTAIERIIRMVGIPHKRIGNKNVTLLGDTKSIALSIPINSQFKESVFH